jgi:uncharacterized protein YjbJ (UPF0337 family)
MAWDRVERRWKQLTGVLKSRWRKLTDDDLNVISGKKDALIGRIQERYGIAKDEAQSQVARWYSSVDRELRDSEAPNQEDQKVLTVTRKVS